MAKDFRNLESDKVAKRIQKAIAYYLRNDLGKAERASPFAGNLT